MRRLFLSIQVSHSHSSRYITYPITKVMLFSLISYHCPSTYTCLHRGLRQSLSYRCPHKVKMCRTKQSSQFSVWFCTWFGEPKLSNFPLVVSSQCILQNQKSQPNSVPYLVGRGEPESLCTTVGRNLECPLEGQTSRVLS